MSGIKSYELVGIVIAASWILGSTVGKLRGPFSLSLSHPNLLSRLIQLATDAELKFLPNRIIAA